MYLLSEKHFNITSKRVSPLYEYLNSSSSIKFSYYVIINSYNYYYIFLNLISYYF